MKRLKPLIVVSNRLPLIARQEEGGWRMRPASGGLVTALQPVLQSARGTWVGWPGTVQEDGVDVDKLLGPAADRIGFSMRTVPLSREDYADFYSRLAGQWHQMGTTRMSESPETGVVDRNCRVHGRSNLFIAGSSVFPTCGESNPTLTICALATRLGDHLAGLHGGEAR